MECKCDDQRGRIQTIIEQIILTFRSHTIFVRTLTTKNIVEKQVKIHCYMTLTSAAEGSPVFQVFAALLFYFAFFIPRDRYNVTH